jgi:hypothetical protein
MMNVGVWVLELTQRLCDLNKDLRVPKCHGAAMSNIVSHIKNTSSGLGKKSLDLLLHDVL